MEEGKLLETIEKVFLEQNNNDMDYLELKKDNIKGIAYHLLNKRQITTTNDWEAVKDGRADFMAYDHWEIDLIKETLKRMGMGLTPDKTTPYYYRGGAVIYNYNVVEM